MADPNPVVVPNQYGGRTTISWNTGDGRDGRLYVSEGGEYDNRRPRDSDEAISHLEAVRAQGAQYLLLPATAFWWLDEYQKFREHIEVRYPAVVRVDGTYDDFPKDDAVRFEHLDGTGEPASIFTRCLVIAEPGSALTADIDVPKDSLADGIPITYVPARNTIFLSLALAWAEVVGASDIVIGVNALDYSGYPDCRPAFLRAFEKVARVATRAGVSGRALRIQAPLLRLSKAEIVRLGTSLGVPYRLTLSCYDPVRGRACGRCDACVLRRKGFAEAGVPDVTLYAASR